LEMNTTDIPNIKKGNNNGGINVLNDLNSVNILTH
jgi:hypothetical protein